MLQLCTYDTQHSKYFCFCSALSNYFCLICSTPLNATTFIFTVAVTSYIEQSYFTYWTELLHILNTVTSYIEQSYFTYWTQLLHVLNTVTSRIEQNYFTYWTRLLHILNTVTSHTEHSYFIYWMPSLVICVWQLPILNFGHYIRLCRGFIQSSREVQYLQSDHNSSLHALSSSPFTNHPTIRTVSPPDRAVNNKRTFAPTCAMKTWNVIGGTAPFMLNLGTWCKWGVSQTLQLFYRGGKGPAAPTE